MGTNDKFKEILSFIRVIWSIYDDQLAVPKCVVGFDEKTGDYEATPNPEFLKVLDLLAGYLDSKYGITRELLYEYFGVNE